jgi:hypothetical protein
VAFDVEVIDVIPDGIAPGLDMILVETSGPVIDETNGIAAGFSGSPVYVDVGGEQMLMGAVAYGCAFCDQRIGGVTPSEVMLDVLDYPNPSTTALSSLSGPASTEVEAAGVGTVELRRLDLPTAVGGLLPRRRRAVAEDLQRAGYDLRPIASGTSGGPVFRPFDPLFPGHSWAGVLASGAFSFAGIGTTTFREGDRSLAFGHPFFFEGRTSMGLSSARVHTVLGDPSQTFGGYKIASVTGAHGIVQQDRLAAVAGREGVFPHMADLDYDLSNVDSGKDRSFRTDAVTAAFFPDLAAISLLGALDVTFDEIGGGTVLLESTIEGRRDGGVPFSVTRTNRFANEFDVTFDSIFELLENLFRIEENGSDTVTFDAVDVSGTLTDQVQLREIVRVRARSSSFRAWRTRRLRAEPGDRITVQAFLQRPRGDTIMVESRVRAPRRAGPASLFVRGGGGFFFEEEFFLLEEGGSAPSLDEVLASIEDAERNDELIVELLRGGQDEPKPDAMDATITDDVIEGFERFRVQVVRR